MLTLKLFEALTGNTRTKLRDRDIQAWARIEYKNDAEYAYSYMVEHGIAPNLGIKA